MRCPVSSLPTSVAIAASRPRRVQATAAFAALPAASKSRNPANGSFAPERMASHGPSSSV